MTKPCRSIILALLGALMAAAPAAAAPTTIDTLPRESGLDAGQGAVVWSRYDDAAKAYRLVVRRNGVNSLPPIDPSPDAFDADLGSNSRGEPAVVYSRCASYRDDRGPRDRCDLYILSLKTGSERALRNANTSASESNPTLWRGELAWISERRGARPTVYHRSLAAGARKSRRLPGLPARACNIHNSRPCSRVTAGAIEELELHGNRLAEIVGYSAGSGDSTEIRLVSLRSTSARRIAFQNIGENNQLYTGLSFSSRKLAWFRGCFENPGCAGSGAYRLGLSTRRYERALQRRLYSGWAWTGAATYTAQLSRYDDDCRQDGSSPAAPCLVARDADPRWRRVTARNVQ